MNTVTTDLTKEVLDSELCNALRRLVKASLEAVRTEQQAVPFIKAKEAAAEELSSAQSAAVKLIGSEDLFFEQNGHIYRISRYGTVSACRLVSL
jgi:hypothetical protein